jgi:glycosyltransferase involved in cell wall biosynthesis
MRVVFDYQVFAFQKYGGISRYIVRLAEGLGARAGCSARIIAPLHVNAYVGELPRGTFLGHAIGASGLNQRIARNVGKRVGPALTAREKPDIVHETYYAADASAPRGVPTVLTVYDMIHEHFASSYASNDPTRTIKRAAVLRADHVLCISESTRRDLLSVIPEAEGKTSVTLLGFDSFGAETAGRGTTTSRPYLLYVGERRLYKNFAGLLKAYASSPRLQASFDIRCFGGGSPGDADRALITELGIAATSVHFDAGDDSALAARYRGAAAFVYPSLYEGFGIPPLEAMSTSCPVIASNTSSIPEICGDAAVYFDPKDPDSICDAIERVAFDTALRADLIDRGHVRLQRFSWDRCTDATIVAYRALL